MDRLIGNTILLREYRKDDIGKIFDWANDKDTTHWMGRKYRNGRPLEDIRKNVNTIINSPPNDGIFYVIANKSNEEYLGGIDITSIDWTDKNGVLSIVVAKKLNRNNGIGSEAIRLLLAYVFRELHLHKVELRGNAENISACQCYKKIGFTIEGTIRDHELIDGKYCNMLYMGILYNEKSNNRCNLSRRPKAWFYGRAPGNTSTSQVKRNVGRTLRAQKEYLTGLIFNIKCNFQSEI